MAIIEGLKPWLNTELYKAEKKSKQDSGKTLINEKYIENLREHGMPEEAIAKLTEKMGDQQESDDVDPPMRVLGKNG